MKSLTCAIYLFILLYFCGAAAAQTPDYAREKREIDALWQAERRFGSAMARGRMQALRAGRVRAVGRAKQ